MPRELRLFSLIPNKQLGIAWFYGDSGSNEGSGHIIILPLNNPKAIERIKINKSPVFGGYYINDGKGKIVTLVGNDEWIVYDLGTKTLKNTSTKNLSVNNVYLDGSWIDRHDNTAINLVYNGKTFEWINWQKSMYNFNFPNEAYLKDYLDEELDSRESIGVNLAINNDHFIVLAWKSLATDIVKAAIYDKLKNQWKFFDLTKDYLSLRCVDGRLMFTVCKLGAPIIPTGKFAIYDSATSNLKWFSAQAGYEILSFLPGDNLIMKNNKKLCIYNMATKKTVYIENYPFNFANINWILKPTQLMP